ncbi:MAG: hypothetical protein NDI61_05910, partial [Bdellovibrionaceae bacterium]|nr:hypothetical protein [Pseudobdellovibrionaceae bacterium]
ESGEPGWLRLGHALLARSEHMGLARRTLDIAVRVSEWNPLDEHLQRRMVVWAYKAGNFTAAANALEQLQKRIAPETKRLPASVVDDEFQRIASLIASRKPRRGADSSASSQASGEGAP